MATNDKPETQTTEANSPEPDAPANGVNAAPASGRAKLEEYPSAILTDEIYECSEGLAEHAASRPEHAHNKFWQFVLSSIGVLVGIGDDIVTVMASTITPQ